MLPILVAPYSSCKVYILNNYSLVISCQCAFDDEEKVDFDVTNLGSHNYFINLHLPWIIRLSDW